MGKYLHHIYHQRVPFSHAHHQDNATHIESREVFIQMEKEKMKAVGRPFEG